MVIVFYSIVVVFFFMGCDYNVVVVCFGYFGLILGVIFMAIVNMIVVMEKFGVVF